MTVAVCYLDDAIHKSEVALSDLALSNAAAGQMDMDCNWRNTEGIRNRLLCIALRDRDSTPIAIILGAIIIALCGLFLLRYEVAPGSTAAYTVRLNRLTGRVAYCGLTGEQASHYKYRCQ